MKTYSHKKYDYIILKDKTFFDDCKHAVKYCSDNQIGIKLLVINHFCQERILKERGMDLDLTRFYIYGILPDIEGIKTRYYKQANQSALLIEKCK